MIDGIKVLRLPISAAEIKSNPFIDLLGFFNSSTGEVKETFKKFGSHKHLDLTLHPSNRIELNGSLHKYYNGENDNDFCIIQINDAIDELAEELQINLSETFLNNVEFGINLELSYPVSRLLNAIINYKSTPFSPMSKTIIKKGQGITVGLEQYYIKIYDKGAQCDLHNNLVRIEIRVVKMKYFENKQMKLQSLADLKNPKIFNQLKTLFIGILNDIIICEQGDLTTHNIPDSERLLIANGCNPKYWERLKSEFKDLNSNCDTYKKLKRKFYYQASNFSKLILRYNLNQLKTDLIEDTEKKWDALINPQQFPLQEQTPIPLCTNSPTLNHKEPRQECTKSHSTLKSGNVQNHHIVKSGISTKENSTKKCKVTGADISDQKPNSRFINDKKAGGYLEAKRIRNMDSNPRNKLRERILRPTKQPTLFDIMNEDIVQLTEEQKDALKFWKGTPYELQIKQNIKNTKN